MLTHLSTADPVTIEWVWVLMLTPEELSGEDAVKRKILESSITPTHKQILRLYYGYDLDFTEIAVLMKSVSGVVSSQLGNAEDRLRQLDKRYKAGDFDANGKRVRKPTCKNCIYHFGGKTEIGHCEYILIEGKSRLSQGAAGRGDVCPLWKYGSPSAKRSLQERQHENWRTQCQAR